MSTTPDDTIALARVEHSRIVAERISNAGHRAARLHFSITREATNYLDKPPTRRELIESGGKPKLLKLDSTAIAECLKECDALGDVEFEMEGMQHSLASWRTQLAELVESLRAFTEPTQ